MDQIKKKFISFERIFTLIFIALGILVILSRLILMFFTNHNDLIVADILLGLIIIFALIYLPIILTFKISFYHYTKALEAKIKNHNFLLMSLLYGICFIIVAFIVTTVLLFVLDYFFPSKSSDFGYPLLMFFFALPSVCINILIISIVAFYLNKTFKKLMTPILG